MALKDEIREQNKKWKTMSPAEKRKYFLTYYKWHVIIFCVILFVVIKMTYDIIQNSHERLLYVMVLNSSGQYLDYGLMDEFAEYAGIDKKQYNLLWDSNNRFDENNADYTSIATIQKFGSYANDGMLEAIILPEENVLYFEQEEYFIIDIKDFLDPEVYAKVEDRIYSYHCESMDEDLEIGFYLKPDDRLYESGLFDEDTSAVLIPLSNSTHLEYLYQFLAFVGEIEE